MICETERDVLAGIVCAVNDQRRIPRQKLFLVFLNVHVCSHGKPDVQDFPDENI